MPTKHHTDSLEELLRQQTDEFKMVPSENTWKAIHRRTHSSRKFPSFTAVAVFLTIIFSARPLGSRHDDKVRHISAIPTQKKATLVHRT